MSFPKALKNYPKIDHLEDWDIDQMAIEFDHLSANSASINYEKNLHVVRGNPASQASHV